MQLVAAEGCGGASRGASGGSEGKTGGANSAKGNETRNLLRQTIGSHWIGGSRGCTPVCLRDGACISDIVRRRCVAGLDTADNVTVCPSVCVRATHHTATTKKRCLGAKTGGLFCLSARFGSRLGCKHAVAQMLLRCERSYHGDDCAAQTRHFCPQSRLVRVLPAAAGKTRLVFCPRLPLEQHELQLAGLSHALFALIFVS